MIVDLKVHVEIVPQRPPGFQHEAPQKFFFFRVRESIFWAKDLATYFNMRSPRKKGVRERFGKVSLKKIGKHGWPFGDKGI